MNTHTKMNRLNLPTASPSCLLPFRLISQVEKREREREREEDREREGDRERERGSERR